MFWEKSERKVIIIIESIYGIPFNKINNKKINFENFRIILYTQMFGSNWIRIEFILNLNIINFYFKIVKIYITLSIKV